MLQFVGSAFPSTGSSNNTVVAFTGGAASVAPTCTNVTYSNSLITCVAVVSAGTSGSWFVSVTVAGSPLSGKTMAVLLYPPAPTIANVLGSCANSSAACVSGATLTIIGTNFDAVTMANDAVNLIPTDPSGNCTPVCVVTAASATSLTCTLNVPSSCEGAFNLSVAVRVAQSGSIKITSQQSPVYTTLGSNGYLNFGGGSSNRGWNGNAATDSPSTPPVETQPAPANTKALVGALAGVSALLVVVIVIAGVLLLRRGPARQALPETLEHPIINADERGADYVPPAIERGDDLYKD